MSVLCQIKSVTHLHKDINYPSKVRGYIAMQPTKFKFIGPDRPPIDTGNSNQYLKLAKTIRDLSYLGFLCRFQHCTGHITTGSWKGRGNQYIEFARVVYCKLPTNGKQLPAFPLKAVTGIEPPTSEVGGESVTTLPPWPLKLLENLVFQTIGK